jgi:menin
MKDANANEVLVPWPPDAEASGQKQEEEAMPRFLVSQSVAAIVGSGAETGQDEQPRIDVAALTDLCGRTLLSPAFFLGTQSQRPVLDSSKATLTVAGIQGSTKRSTTAAETGTANNANENQLSTKAKPRLYLRSHKMAGLKDLLLAEKLNTHAISLQLTAQSQVQLGGRGKLRENAEPKDVVNKTNDKDPGARGESHSTPVPSRPKRNRKE